MGLLSICPCLESWFKPAHVENNSLDGTTTSRKTRRRTSRSSRRTSKSRRRKNDYLNKFFNNGPKLAPEDLVFSHRLSTIANDRLINFIDLPLKLNPTDGGGNQAVQTKPITIKSPDQFLRWMHFERIKLLGRGGFGSVYLVKKLVSVDNGNVDKPQTVSLKMACKEIRLKVKDHSLINSLRAELYVLQSLSDKCRYVVNYFEHYVLGYFSEVEQCQTSLACIFMEFADGGCLLDEVEKKGPLKVDLVKRYFSEMAEGLAFMHRNQIAHNDFKLDNVLLMWDEKHKEKYCILTDFGMARFAFKDGVGVLYSQRHCGTRRYMAPEVIRCGLEKGANAQYIPFSADIWSLGVSLYVMLIRDYPYNCPKNYSELYQLMKHGVLSSKSKYLRKKFGSKLTQLLSAMLEFDPDVRYSISRVVSHSWLKRKQN